MASRAPLAGWQPTLIVLLFLSSSLISASVSTTDSKNASPRRWCGTCPGVLPYSPYYGLGLGQTGIYPGSLAAMNPAAALGGLYSGGCVDLSAQCATYASTGQCATNPVLIRRLCPISCGTGCVATPLAGGAGLLGGGMYGTGYPYGLGLGTGLGAGVAPGLGTGLGYGNGIGLGYGAGLGYGTGLGYGAGLGGYPYGAGYPGALPGAAGLGLGLLPGQSIYEAAGIARQKKPFSKRVDSALQPLSPQLMAKNSQR